MAQILASDWLIHITLPSDWSPLTSHCLVTDSAQLLTLTPGCPVTRLMVELLPVPVVPITEDNDQSEASKLIT